MATQYSVQELREIIAETIFNADNAKLYLLGQLLAMLKPNVLCLFMVCNFFHYAYFLCDVYFFVQSIFLCFA